MRLPLSAELLPQTPTCLSSQSRLDRAQRPEPLPLSMAASGANYKQTRKVYSAEQLHRLRGTVSTPRLNESIDEHDGEDAELVKGKFALVVDVLAATSVARGMNITTTSGCPQQYTAFHICSLTITFIG